MEKVLEIGTSVRASSKHWLRPNEIGTIVEITERGENRYKVEFPTRVGGGFDGGCHLYLSDHNFSRLEG